MYVHVCSLYLAVNLLWPSKNDSLIEKTSFKIVADSILIFFYLYSSQKVRLDISCESSARQKIHMKYHSLFSLKNNT